MKEGLLSKDHACYTVQTPHIQAILIHLLLQKVLWSHEVPGGHLDIIVLGRMIKFPSRPQHISHSFSGGALS